MLWTAQALALALSLLARAAPAAGAGETGADPAAAESELLAGIRARVAEAYGGEDHLASFGGFRARGRVLSLARGVSGRLRLALSLRGAMRVEIRYPDRTEVRILSGPLAWNGNRRRQRPSPERLADSMRLQYHRLAAPFELVMAPPGDLEVAGTSEEGWIRVRRRWDERTETVYEIDPDTGRILRVRGRASGGENGLEFVSDADDFREVGGVLFPFRTTTRVSDQMTAETILERVVPDSALAPEEFRPAGAPEEI